MTQFTKGKWTADDMGEYVFAHGFDMMICQMRGWAYLKAQGLSDAEAIEVQKANARLIAAAPDMYHWIESLLHDINLNDDSSILGDIRELASLIARIQGDSENLNLNSL